MILWRDAEEFLKGKRALNQAHVEIQAGKSCEKLIMNYRFCRPYNWSWIFLNCFQLEFRLDFPSNQGAFLFHDYLSMIELLPFASARRGIFNLATMHSAVLNILETAQITSRHY